MRFLAPEMFWLFAALPLGVLVVIGSIARRRRALETFAGSPKMVAPFVAQVSVHRRTAKLLLLGLALAAGIVAAARPQWGTRLEQVTRKGIDLIVVLDTSLSMAAEDIAPNRLGLALHEVDRLLEALAGNRVALITFAGQATLACPLTLDHTAVRLFLDSMQVEGTQVPGTALADALNLAVRSFGGAESGGDDRGRAIVLFSDGEDHEGGIEPALEEIRQAGATVYAVGTGTTRGAPIPVRDAGGSSTGYKKDREGKLVTTRLEEAVLQRLALQTRGQYYRATPGEAEIGEISQVLASLDAREFGAVLRTRYEERFQIPLALAFLCLVGETLLGDRQRGRARRELG